MLSIVPQPLPQYDLKIMIFSKKSREHTREVYLKIFLDIKISISFKKKIQNDSMMRSMNLLKVDFLLNLRSTRKLSIHFFLNPAS